MPASKQGDTIRERLARIEQKIDDMLEHCHAEQEFGKAIGGRVGVLEGWHGRMTWALGAAWVVILPIVGLWLKSRLGL